MLEIRYSFTLHQSVHLRAVLMQKERRECSHEQRMGAICSLDLYRNQANFVTVGLEKRLKCAPACPPLHHQDQAPTMRIISENQENLGEYYWCLSVARRINRRKGPFILWRQFVFVCSVWDIRQTNPVASQPYAVDGSPDAYGTVVAVCLEPQKH